MAKKIIETIERWCCEPQDLVPFPDSIRIGDGTFDIVFCVHCGARFEFHAGEYREAQP